MGLNHIIKLVAVIGVLLFANDMVAQERVYLSTDKNIYLAGEDVWFSVFCTDEENSGEPSRMSRLAYLGFYNAEGLAATVKVALKDGRGYGKFKIPFSFRTGNYSIVSYTSRYGGDSKGEFEGKIITVFNTMTAEKVAEGVEVVGKGESLEGAAGASANSAGIGVQVGDNSADAVPVKISNNSESKVSLNVSVYHLDKLEAITGERGYNTVPLKGRKGDFVESGEPDYAGEVIKVRISPAAGRNGDVANKTVYMSVIGDTDDVYVNTTNKNGETVFYTNNIYGNRDMVFEVGSDTLAGYDVEFLGSSAVHTPAAIPVLKMWDDMKEALEERSLKMQISRRFEADTIFDVMDMRANSFIGRAVPKVYNLDEYTRFPIMEEVIREYVKDLRVRREGSQQVLKVMWEAIGQPLVLLDGVPLQDHSKVINLDPLLVKQIVIYPRRYILNNHTFEGVVKFITYKGDLGGVKFGKNVSIHSYAGASYPLAFLGGKVQGSESYPNYNSTIYWNPAITLNSGEAFSFECIKPNYSGTFRVVVEGFDSKGEEVYFSTTFQTK